jgi:hypothetical protein
MIQLEAEFIVTWYPRYPTLVTTYYYYGEVAMYKRRHSIQPKN